MIPFFIGVLAVGIIGTALLFAFKNAKPIVKILILAVMLVLFAVLIFLMFKALLNG
jgi:hypothetical protein